MYNCIIITENKNCFPCVLSAKSIKELKNFYSVKVIIDEKGVKK